MKPEIRFNGFSDEWVEKKLDQSEIRVATGKLNANAATTNGKYPFFTTALETYMTDSYSFDDDAILIAGNGNLGFVKEYNGKFDAYQREYVLTNFEGYAKSYLVSYFKHLLGEHISHSSKGSAMPYITKDVLESFLIAVPSLPEQQKIGQLFSKYDAIIALYEQKLAELNALKKGLLQQMFDDGVATNHKPQVRFSGFNDEWVEKKFDECFDFPVSTNSLSRALLNYDEGDIKSVHYGDILIKYPSVLNVKNDKIPYITDGKLEKYKSNLLENGDLIFADAAEDETVGKAVEVNGLTEENLVSGLHTIVARSKDKKAEFFLGYYVNSNIYHRQLLKLMQGSKVSSISKGNLQKTLVSFPKDFEEQQKIGQLFKHLDARISNEQSKIEQLKAQKQGLLQKML